MEFMPGYFGRIAPRSGLAFYQGLEVGAGIIDNDFRGVIKIVIFNHSTKDFKVFFSDTLI
jgi:dUTP pyrophosphatase